MWYCHACDLGGDIITYIEKKHGYEKGEIIRNLANEFKLKKTDSRIHEYIYKDVDGKEIFKKVKKIDAAGNKDYIFFHKENGVWSQKMGKHKPIPYNLERFKDYEELICCEGEKDCDNVNNLEISLLATSAPFGQNSWNDSLTRYFEGKKRLYFLYDVGAEKCVEEHASKIKSSLPALDVYVCRVPMPDREDDITNFLEKFENKQIKKEKLLEIINKAEILELSTTLKERGFENIFIGNFEDFLLEDIPEIEYLIDPYVFKGGLTEVGGVKGSHKSFFVTQMALYYASGVSPFLTGNIETPGKVLLIQQEISMGFMKKRLMQMILSGSFFTEKRFFPVTTTAQQLKLLNQNDYDLIRRWIDDYKPDILVLDPLSSFNTTEENMSKDMAKIVNRLSELKATYNLGLVITHHFSSKRNPNDPAAPVEAGAWFRGHTVLSDAADILICLHRLPGQRENPNLPKAYEDYNLVEIALRNDRQPPKFAIEFDEGTFLLKESTIWQEIGKRIMPGQIEELLQANDGRMLQKDIIDYFKPTARPTTVKRAISEAIRQGLIKKEILEGRGSPAQLKLTGIISDV